MQFNRFNRALVLVQFFPLINLFLSQVINYANNNKGDYINGLIINLYKNIYAKKLRIKRLGKCAPTRGRSKSFGGV